MSESVQILIEAEDNASVKLAQAAENVAKAEKKIENVLKSLQSPADRYEAELREIEALHASGSISAEKFARAQAGLQEKIRANGNAFKEMGGKAKASTEFVGVLASLTGNSEIAGFAGQMAGMTEKVGQFSEVSKAGGAGALAFKLGLVALVATIAISAGKAIGDFIFNTAKLERALEKAKQKAADLSATLIALNNTQTNEQREDIELIRDPEQKQAAYQQLLDGLNRDVQAVEGNVRSSEKAVEEWADAWKVTGDRKLFEQMAIAELANDKERLKALKAQQAELVRITSERTAQNELLKQENAAKDKSEAYLQSLRDEVELLRASKEERLAIEAARNTTTADQGEAERLLKERDGILAKQEAERKLEDDRKQADKDRIDALVTAGETWAAIGKAITDAANKEIAAAEAAKKKIEDERTAELQKIEDIKTSELERLELRRIEIEQGKEAAKAQALINQGVDADDAKKIAAEETRLDAMEQAKIKAAEAANEANKIDDKESQKAPGAQGIQAVQGRLITRGSADQKGDEIANNTAATVAALRKLEGIQKRAEDRQAKLEERLANNPNIVLQGTP